MSTRELADVIREVIESAPPLSQADKGRLWPLLDGGTTADEGAASWAPRGNTRCDGDRRVKHQA